MDKKKILCPVVLLLSVLFFILANTNSANAASVSLNWDANTPSPEGYKVFYRLAHQEYDYDNPTWQGSSTSCVIKDLKSGNTYCFVVRAYNGNLESMDSNEVTFKASENTSSETDTTPPSWSGATSGIGAAEDNGAGGSVTIEFDTATDAVDGTNLNFNVYYAPTQTWNKSDWTENNTITHISTSTGGIFTYAANLNNLTTGVSYNIGVRAEDQSGNEDANTSTLTVTPTTSTDISKSSDSSIGLSTNFENTTLTNKLAYYTDRDYKLTNVPSDYLGLSAILLPNDGRNNTSSSGYLTFVMPDDGMVYVAYDSRAKSLPNWMSGFSATGDRIYTSLSSQPYLVVFEKWYAAGATVNLGGNKATGFSGSTVSNYLVFYETGVDNTSDSTSTTPTTPTLSVSSKFTKTVLSKGMAYYTDRAYTLNNIPSDYSGLGAILTPNDERNNTKVSGYLTFEMPDDGMVYVGYDSRAKSLPNWMSSFSATGERIYTSLSTQPYLVVFEKWYAAGATVNLGANKATGFSGGTVSNYLVLYELGIDGQSTDTSSSTTSSSTNDLASKFEQDILTTSMTYYTDRNYTLTNIPSAYLNSEAIFTPNDERNNTAASGYLTFAMPEDGVVYVAYDSRANSLPNWLRGFSNTGKRIYTSLSTQPYLKVYQKSYAAGATVNLGANKATGFSGGTVSNYLVFY